MTPQAVAVLTDAFNKHAWPVVAIVTIYALVQAAKVGGLWDRLPRAYQPLIIVGVGVLSGVVEALTQGTPWPLAIVMGVMSALVPIGAHQVVTKPAKVKREEAGVIVSCPQCGKPLSVRPPALGSFSKCEQQRNLYGTRPTYHTRSDRTVP